MVTAPAIQGAWGGITPTNGTIKRNTPSVRAVLRSLQVVDRGMTSTVESTASWPNSVTLAGNSTRVSEPGSGSVWGWGRVRKVPVMTREDSRTTLPTPAGTGRASTIPPGQVST